MHPHQTPVWMHFEPLFCTVLENKRKSASRRHNALPPMRFLKRWAHCRRNIGYRRDPNTRAACVATNVITGESHPNVNFGVKQIDTGMSAYHYQARRDENFKKLQALRMNTFCVVHGAIWGI